MSRFLIVLMMGMGLCGQSLPDLTVASISTTNVTTDTQSLLVSGTLGVTVRNLGAPVATVFRVVAWEDRDGNGVLNAGTDVTLGSAASNGTIATGGDQVVVIPIAGRVLFRGNRIYVKVDSGESVAESDETNNIRFSSEGQGGSISVGAFSPSLKWSWTGSSILPSFKQVMVTPLVANMNDDNGDEKINELDYPDVIFQAADNSNDRLTNVDGGVIRVIDGRTGREILTITDPALRVAPYASMAVGDLEGDGIPEIVAIRQNRILIFRNNGTLKATTDPLPSGTAWVGSISLADLDKDGSVEILWGANVFDNKGKLLRTAPACGYGNTWGPNSFAVDLDLDGEIEIVDGGGVYSKSGQQKFCYVQGWSAVANLDGDPMAEIVVMSSGLVYALEHDGKLKWQTKLPGGGTGGAPTIADFDGDGQAEIGIAGAAAYSVFETDGTLKWTIPTSDASSGFTGSSVFDFDGDGRVEVVYNDEFQLRILDGRTGGTLFQSPNPNCTGIEYPLIVDVDKDQHADIVVSRNTFCGLAAQLGISTSGIFVYSDTRWVGTRSIWNQHAYSITNVNDDGTIPRSPTPNWVVPGLNNFRLNTFSQPGLATGLPDFTSSLIRKDDSTFPASVRLTARVGNGGSTAQSSRTAAGTVVGPNLIQNGSFESGSPTCPTGSFDTRRSTGSTATSILGWRVVKDDIHYVDRGYWQAADGNCSIDMDGEVGSAGAIEQAISTVSGRTYEIAFRMAGNLASVPVIKTLRVSAAGKSSDFSFDVTNKSFLSMGYEVRIWRFVAIGTTTTIRFESTTSPSGWGPVIDSVDVREIALPSQMVGVAFYRGDPASSGSLIGTTRTSKALEPGEFEDVSVTWSNATAGLHPIVVVADENGAGVGVIAESDETNNKAGANILLGVGPFPLVDSLLTRFKDKAVDLEWAAVAGATGYNLYRRTGSSSFQLVQRGLLVNRYSDAGLTNGMAYTYVVRWLNTSGVESADGTEASAIPTPDVRTDGTPPTILSNPLTRARTGNLYTYQVNSGDPDPGDTRTYSLTTAPAGMTISASGLVQWTPSASQFGYANVTVRVQDRTLKAATQTFRLFTEVEIINNPPVITSSAPTRGLSGETYSYRVLARDPDTGDFLTYSLAAAPVGMSINPATGLISWLPTRQQIATHPVTVRVTDLGGLRAKQSFAVVVARGNTAPRFTSFPVTFTRAGSGYRYQPTALDAESDPLTYKLDSVVPAAAITVDGAAGTVAWTVPTGAAGTAFEVTIRVTDDGGLSATQAYRISVGAANQPPVISSTAVTTAVANVSYRYAVTATDPNLPDEALTYSLVIAPVGMTIAPLTGVVDWVPGAPLGGTNVNVAVRVTDQGGLTATQTFVVAVRPPDLTRPAVSLLGPANGSTLTNDAPVTGTVTDDNLRLWRVEYRTVDAPDWRVLSTGTTNVPTVGSLGTFPATLLANDVYRMRLYAEDAGGSVTSPEIEVTIDTKQLKMGDFTLSYEDLRVPGFTFPISIVRKYDTKRPQVGDFGPGWTLSFSEVDVRLDVNKNPTLTLPDGRRVKFTYEPVCVGFSPLLGCIFPVYNSTYVAPPGVQDKLENMDCPQTIGRGAVATCGFGPYVARAWRLTTREGMKYEITDGAVTRMEDRNGNWLKITKDGVESNTRRSVGFERDSAGRITRVNEPAPGGSLRYEYDAQGRLRRFIKQDGAATTFEYEYARLPHYLTKITDPLGRPSLRNVFNAEGRMIAQCDAIGDITTLAGCQRFDPQPSTKAFTSINGRGLKTELLIDDRGNVTTERRFTGAATYLEIQRQYNTKGKLLVERDPAGSVKSFTYNDQDEVVAESDAEGNVTRYEYNSACGAISRVTNPAGQVTTNVFDPQCNLRFVTDAAGATVEYRYNSSGQRTAMIDPSGSMWAWSYNQFGLLEAMTDPAGRTISFKFDAIGNLLSRVDRLGRRIEFFYDRAGRVILERWVGVATSIVYQYDLAGSLVVAAGPDNSVTMKYNNLGLLSDVSTVTSVVEPPVSLEYGYDENQNVVRVSDSLGGHTEYGYDALDRLVRVRQSGTAVKEKRVDIEYDVSSAVVKLSRFSDLAGAQPVVDTTFSYQCPGCTLRVSKINHQRAQDKSTIDDIRFQRNELGDVVSSSDRDGLHTFTYDSSRRLLSVAHSGSGGQPNEFYGYDFAGNRVKSHLSSTYRYGDTRQSLNNRLDADDTYLYEYDFEGNLSRRVERVTGNYLEFEYDYKNRCVRVTKKTASGSRIDDVRFQFDAFGRRVRAVGSTYQFSYVYDSGQVVAVTGRDDRGPSVLRLLTTRRLDGVLAQEVGGMTNWFMLDHAQSVRALVDSSGNVVGTKRYEAFGNLINDVGEKSIVTFQSREPVLDSFMYFRARMYDANSGRFGSEDPREPYAYAFARNNPMSFSDPTGETTIVQYAIASNIVWAKVTLVSRLVNKDCDPTSAVLGYYWDLFSYRRVFELLVRPLAGFKHIVPNELVFPLFCEVPTSR
jgi:choice-of-anchor C domain-containing protein